MQLYPNISPLYKLHLQIAMLPKLKLISHNLCPYVQRSLIAVLEKQIPCDREYIDLANKPDWFLKISPLGKVPLLLVDDEILFESAVICEYLDEITPDSLHPEDALTKAKHRSWIEFGSNLLTKIAGFYSAKDEETFEAKRLDLITNLELLEAQLIAAPYFVGEKFSLIDAVYAPIFRYFVAFDRYQNFGFSDRTPKVKAWREALLGRPSVQQAVDENYYELLDEFFQKRNSFLSKLIK
ncbi:MULTISPECIES: glutathione S-transferase family protein [Pseudanabaena]|uniref:glutathione transferase n=2 Tax=Pseudanabaena TaxID=1152 RepID=L8N1W8_9CYAN|nr:MULTISPECIES: glutathione S-transferase family protein [Pseudanabaena]ELS32238.1 Glutathione S-transferase domain protein [Pseudanabaena biceps PCC 7429]MDG3495519.1 glutathione S-transferase family protein [Pseudanabaena catenata USMAC16]